MNFSQAQETDETHETSCFPNVIKFNSFISDGIAQSTSTGTHHSEPPTPPRTPITASGLTAAAAASVTAAVPDLTADHHASDVAVSAIIANFQQTLSERIIRLHREGIAIADDTEQQRPLDSGSNGSPKISVTPTSKLMDASKLRRAASPMDRVPSSDTGACDSYSEQDFDEDASRAFDLSFRYTDDSNLSPSGVCSEEDRYSETGTGVDSLNDASSYDSIRAGSSYKTSDGNSFGGGDKSANLVSLIYIYFRFLWWNVLVYAGMIVKICLW